jgi:8-oxo-dGTP pyrophosphatase MutT (NUDIX family)
MFLPSGNRRFSTMVVLSAGVVVVRKEKGIWKFLFLRAYNYWDFPKGVVEPGEDPLKTAVREVEEETGITDLHFSWDAIYKETSPYYSRGEKKARYYIAHTHQSSVKFSVNPVLGKPEHHEYRWLTYDEIISLASERLFPVIEWADSILTGGHSKCIRTHNGSAGAIS